MPRPPKLPDQGPMRNWTIRTTDRARQRITERAGLRAMSVGEYLDWLSQQSAIHNDLATIREPAPLQPDITAPDLGQPLARQEYEDSEISEPDSRIVKAEPERLQGETREAAMINWHTTGDVPLAAAHDLKAFLQAHPAQCLHRKARQVVGASGLIRYECLMCGSNVPKPGSQVAD